MDKTTAAELAKIEMAEIAAAQTTDVLIESFEITSAQPAKKIDTETFMAIAETRGVIMDELEKRDPAAFSAWLDSVVESPRDWFIS